MNVRPQITSLTVAALLLGPLAALLTAEPAPDAAAQGMNRTRWMQKSTGLETALHVEDAVVPRGVLSTKAIGAMAPDELPMAVSLAGVNPRNLTMTVPAVYNSLSFCTGSLVPLR